MSSIWTRCLTSLLGLFVALAALEIIFRILPTPKPQFSYQHERPAFFYLDRSARTMQGNDPISPKKAGEFRIVVLGDSFSFAPGMQFLDAFPKKLQALLQTSSNVSVVNLGTPGFSTEHEAVAFDQALAYSPDVILLQVTLNDPQLRPLQEEPEEIRGSFGSYEPHSLLARHSRFISWVGARLHNTRSVSAYINYHQYLWRDNWTRFADPFEQMRAKAAAAKVGFGVVLFPLFDFSLTRASYPFLDIHKKIQSFVRGSGTPMLDLFPAYEGLDPYRLQLLPSRDTHPNEIAHRIAAEQIYWWLRGKPFFPRERKLNRLYPRRYNVREGQFPKPSRRLQPH